MQASTPTTVAIVGRPNVGKSTLFNKLVGWRKAITLDTPGVTRDAIAESVRWNGEELILVDTGGLGGEAEIELADKVHAHTVAAIAEADVLVVLFDARQGLNPLDADTVALAKEAGVPTVYVGNKADGPSQEEALGEFCELGIAPPLAVSAEHGRGLDALREAILESVSAARAHPQGRSKGAAGPRRPAPARERVRERRKPPGNKRGERPASRTRGQQPEATAASIDEEAHEATADESVGGEACRVALVGRPNVGKSSLLNRLAGHTLSLVDEVPGTTRDVVDTLIERSGKRYILLDTAGIRRPSRVARGVEKISARRSLDAIERADVVVLMVEPRELVASQDARIARTAWEQGRALVIIVNKIDLLPARMSPDAIRRSITESYSSLANVPVGFLSVVQGRGVAKCFELIDKATAAHRTTIQTARLNRIISDAVARQPPPVVAGGRIRIFYAAQTSTAPPTITVFVNRARIPVHYQRYLERSIRSQVDLEGTPLRLWFKRRSSH